MSYVRCLQNFGYKNVKLRKKFESFRRGCYGSIEKDINPLNAELNPVCHLLTLLRAHHILHVSRIKVKEI